MFHPYLVGTKLILGGDHQPLLSFYNNFTEPATPRITKHIYKIMDLTFTDKYLPGKKMPGDYNFRHPAPIPPQKTSAEDNIQAFSEIFSRHRVPDILH